MGLSEFKFNGRFKSKSNKGYYTSIKCNSLEQVNNVLDKLGENECLWADYTPLKEHRKVLEDCHLPIYLNRRVTTVTFSNFPVHDELSYDEFMDNGNGENNRITVKHIAGDNKVVAEDEHGNVAEAKCHPDDEFKFSTGARIALNRLLEGLTTNKESTIRVGDKVKFRLLGRVIPYADEWMDQWAKDSWKLRYAWGVPHVRDSYNISESVVVKIAPNKANRAEKLALVKVNYNGLDVPSYYLTELDNLVKE